MQNVNIVNMSMENEINEMFRGNPRIVLRQCTGMHQCFINVASTLNPQLLILPLASTSWAWCSRSHSRSRLAPIV
jgi:hypothetical protein